MDTNLVMALGVDWTRVITYTQSNGTPVDLSGYTARMQVRAHALDSTKILDLNTSNGGIVLGGTAGTITLILTNAQLTEGPTGLNLSSIISPAAQLVETQATGNLMGWGKQARYDLDVISPSGVITKILSGKVCFDYSVCR